jgi:hypothetical protein
MQPYQVQTLLWVRWVPAMLFSSSLYPAPAALHIAPAPSVGPEVKVLALHPPIMDVPDTDSASLATPPPLGCVSDKQASGVRMLGINLR